jgi:hypothetical protein
MPQRPLEPPSGDPPPSSVSLGGDDKPIDLVGLAGEICRRYREEFPDEEGRYGAAGTAWCVHDNQWLLSWAAESVSDYLDMNNEVGWLASVLEARGFPLERLSRDLEIGADVVRERVSGKPGEQLAGVLVDAAAFVRSRGTAQKARNDLHAPAAASRSQS